MEEILGLLIRASFRFALILLIFPLVAIIATPYILMAAIPAKEDNEFLINCQTDAASTYLGRVWQKYMKLLHYFLSGWDPDL